jgi:hypothetical protein
MTDQFPEPSFEWKQESMPDDGDLMNPWPDFHVSGATVAVIGSKSII